MSHRFPVLAALAADVALGYRDLGMRLRASIERLRVLVTAGLAVCLIVGYQVVRWQERLLRLNGQVRRWLGRDEGAPATADEAAGLTPDDVPAGSEGPARARVQ